MKTIIGIDPGSIVTGFGVVQSDGYRYKYVTSGCIRLGKGKVFDRLQKIFMELSKVVVSCQPDVAAIEQVFFHTNPKSALILGQARGAAIVALADNSLPVTEYSAREIKQAVVGYGAAGKQQVQNMVKILLKIEGEIAVDAADALAIAICHANSKMGYGAKQ